MRHAGLIAMVVGLMAAAESLGVTAPSTRAPREPRRFTCADAERLAKAEAKRARLAARRAAQPQENKHG